MSKRQPMIGVRVSPEFRKQIQAEADRNFGGNESLMLRKGAELYLRLRETFGVQFEPTIASLLGDDGEDRQAA